MTGAFFYWFKKKEDIIKIGFLNSGAENLCTVVRGLSPPVPRRTGNFSFNILYAR